MAGALLILGAGAMAEALAGALVARADPAHALLGDVLIWARREEAAEAVAERTGARAITSLKESGTLDLEAVLFCVSDGAIADLALRLADSWSHVVRISSPVALHTSGFHGIEVLASLASLGLERGTLHPVVSVRGLSAVPAVAFEGVRFGVSGDPLALEMARDLAVALGGVPLTLPRGGRRLYHAAASLLSGGLVALFAEARAALREAMPDVEPDEIDALCRVLARSTLQNLESKTPESALTGPVARGDRAVVEGHLASFAASATPARAELYAELVAAMERLLRKES